MNERINVRPSPRSTEPSPGFHWPLSRTSTRSHPSSSSVARNSNVDRHGCWACSIAFAHCLPDREDDLRCRILLRPPRRRARREMHRRTSTSPSRSRARRGRSSSTSAVASRRASTAMSSGRSSSPISAATSASTSSSGSSSLSVAACGEQLEPFVERPATALDQPVRVEHDRRALFELCLPRLEPQRRVDADRQRPASVQERRSCRRSHGRAAADARPRRTARPARGSTTRYASVANGTSIIPSTSMPSRETTSYGSVCSNANARSAFRS